jgi:putative two-component system response regulator
MKRILIVEDNEVAATMLECILTTAGYQTEIARDGQEALERIRKGDIRLVVSDWEMPNMTGLALCRAIRTEDLPGYVYVILLTSHSQVEERIAGLSVGADDYVVKPFNAEELIHRIRSGERVLALQKPKGV